MSRIIELRWTCSSCGAKDILGRHKICLSCGSPREKGEMQMDGLSSDCDGDGYNDAVSVKGRSLLELAMASADWFCTHCEKGNRGDGDTCSSCGAPRYGEKGENHPALEFSRDHEGKKKPEEWELTEDVECQEELAREDEDACRIRLEAEQKKREEVHRLAREEAEWEVEQEARRLKQKRREGLTRMFMIAGGVLAVLGVVFFIFWGMQTHSVQGTVTQMSWVHNTHRWSWTQIYKENWRSNLSERSEILPVNGQGERAGIGIVSCYQKHHHYEEYQCGTKEESYDCSTSHTESYQGTCSKSESYTCGETCRDNGNGFATCSPKTCTRQVSYSCTKTRTVRDPKTCHRTVPKICERSIEKPWCSYKTQEWRKVETQTASGRGEEDLYWKDINLGPLDKSTRSFKYAVIVEYTDKDRQFHYEQKCDSLSDYKSWDEGESVTLHKRNFGWISGMEHGGRVFEIGGEG